MVKIVFPITQFANISRKWFCVQNVSKVVMIQIEIDPDHVWFLLLEKLGKNHDKCFQEGFLMSTSFMVFPNFSRNMNLT